MQVGTFVLICIALSLVGHGHRAFHGFAGLSGIGRWPHGSCRPCRCGVRVMRQRRFDKFEEQFPEAMDLLGRAVRAGHAFTTGFELIGKELPDPVGQEFKVAFQQQKPGTAACETPLKTSRCACHFRMFEFSSPRSRSNAKPGGNLGEVLDTHVPTS